MSYPPSIDLENGPQLRKNFRPNTVNHGPTLPGTLQETRVSHLLEVMRHRRLTQSHPLGQLTYRKWASPTRRKVGENLQARRIPQHLKQQRVTLRIGLAERASA